MRTLLALWVLCALVQADMLRALEELLPPALIDTAPDVLRVASAACDLLPLEVMLMSGAMGTGGRGAVRARVVEMRRGGARRAMGVRAAARRVGRGPLAVYVPGWWNSPHDEAAEALVEALLAHVPVVLVLDTRAAFCRGYVAAAARVGTVSRALHALLKALLDAGVTPDAVHVVGFSLGAHAAGVAGRLAGGTLGRLTALDPAKPCFGRGGLRVSAADAQFVQVVHSSAGALGLAEPLGHADVYVAPTPECARRPLPFECDHNQAWRVFAASAGSDGAMAARRCRSQAELATGTCTGDMALLGFHCSNDTRGIYLYKS